MGSLCLVLQTSLQLARIGQHEMSNYCALFWLFCCSLSLPVAFFAIGESSSACVYKCIHVHVRTAMHPLLFAMQFFPAYMKLLQSGNYVTRRQSLKVRDIPPALV